jgi:hypothetical protein
VTQVHQLFNSFLNDVVRFTGAEQEQADRSQAYLRERLQAYSAAHPDFPNLIDGDFLSGSFGTEDARVITQLLIDDVLKPIADPLGLSPHERSSH